MNPVVNALVRLFNLVAAVVFGKGPDGERRVWLHWQNLNEDRKGRPRGLPWHGRAWLNIGRRASLHWSWNFWTHFCGAAFAVDSEAAGMNWHLALPPIALWFGVEGILPRGWINDLGNRDISLRIHNAAIWWNIWRDDSGWSRSVPRWRHGNVNLLDLLIGKQEYSAETLSERAVTIPMPEGGYPATVRLFESTWKRPRWFARRLDRAEVKMEKPIPFPGKGENSWDCGEDALHGLTTRASTVEQAVAATVERALRARRRNGGDAMMLYPARAAAPA